MMKRNRKAQGLSLNMVAVGVISITLLVIIIAIFVSSMQESQDQIGKSSKGISCDKSRTANLDIDDDGTNENVHYEVRSYDNCEHIAQGSWTYPTDSTEGEAGEPLDVIRHVCCIVED